jgi:hypothetical protein
VYKYIYTRITRFNNDKHGKKREWRKTIEDNLKQMLVLNDNDELPAGKIRNAFYAGLQYGPIKVCSGDGVYVNAFYAGVYGMSSARYSLFIFQFSPCLSRQDTESVRENHITTNAGEKEAFKDICRTNSILRDMKEI